MEYIIPLIFVLLIAAGLFFYKNRDKNTSRGSGSNSGGLTGDKDNQITN